MYRLLKIDELLISDHYYLTEEDDCSYLMEYRPHVLDSVKSIILNFKKTVDRKDKPDYKYKGIETNKIASIFERSIPQFETSDTILVPIPPSKVKGHELYDDRILRLLNIFCRNRQNCDVRELIITKENQESFHRSTKGQPLPSLKAI